MEKNMAGNEVVAGNVGGNGSVAGNENGLGRKPRAFCALCVPPFLCCCALLSVVTTVSNL